MHFNGGWTHPVVFDFFIDGVRDFNFARRGTQRIKSIFQLLEMACESGQCVVLLHTHAGLDL